MHLRKTLAKWLFAAAALVSGAAAAATADLFALASAQTSEAAPRAVTAALLSSYRDVRSKTSFDIAIKLQHEYGWHTYWLNPGTSGKPTGIKLRVPAGWKVQNLGWPTPDRVRKGPITSFVYSGQTLIPFRVTVPASEKINTEQTITAHVEWLACKDVCIPGEADLTLPIRVTEIVVATSQAEQILQSEKLLPKQIGESSRVQARYEANRLRIDVVKSLGKIENKIDVFIADRGLINYEQEPVRQDGEDTISLYFKTTELFQQKPPEKFMAVVVADSPRSNGWAVQTEVIPEPGHVSRIPFLSMESTVQETPGVSLSSLSAILFAFLGGIILNLMPCVFPVLSLKILQLVGTERRKGALWVHGSAFTVGILLSMLVLSGTLIALRSAGAAIGWGFQLQSPWVVTILALLFFSITLNLLGLFEFTAASRLADARAIRSLPAHGPAGSFWTGVLAVVIASPCTAPFMGAALGYAITQGAKEATAIFLALGFGMALPWLLLTIVPFWTRWLPRPGAWMITMRRIMAIPMSLAVLWLLWVLSHQIDLYGIVTVVIAAGAVTILLWAIGRAQYGRSSSSVLKAVCACLSVVCIGLISTGLFNSNQESQTIGWERWSEQSVLDALEHKSHVIVDYTAAWCVTCQFNEANAIRTKRAEAVMTRLGYRKFVADWTNRDEAITRSLARFGRTGVPLYVLYNGKTGQARVLPELITAPMFIEALEKNAAD